MATKKFNEGITIIKKRKLYFIEVIVVDEQYRRKGIAKKLYNYLLNQSIDDNADAIELNAWSFNKDAIKFYEYLGMAIKEIKFEQLLSIH